jgi:hypothetical protein
MDYSRHMVTICRLGSTGVPIRLAASGAEDGPAAATLAAFALLPDFDFLVRVIMLLGCVDGESGQAVGL